MADSDQNDAGEVKDKPAEDGKRRVGRPSESKFSPLNMSVEEAVAELSTAEGIMKRRAELYLRARRGGTAIELEYIRREEALLNKCEVAVRERDQINAAHELTRAMEAMKKMAEGNRQDARRRNQVTTPPVVPRSKGRLQ